MDDSTEGGQDILPLARRDGGRAPDKIVLIVRSRLLREGLRYLLGEADFDTVAEIATADEIPRLRDISDPAQIGLALVEASFCVDGNDLLVCLRRDLPAARIILLASPDALLKLADVAAEFVDGIITSEVSGRLLIRQLRLILPGHCIVPLTFIRSLLGPRAEALNGVREPSAEEQAPSRREREILRCLVDGCSNKVIARQLGITEATVKVHLKGLLRKIRAANRTQAAIWALDNGILGALPPADAAKNRAARDRSAGCAARDKLAPVLAEPSLGE